jgi:lauroyl/myristoyl acyltransferase
LAAADRAIILTAHMGNYELGAGLFIEKFKRKIRIVRAPEPAGQIISIQGDRVVGDVARLATNFFQETSFSADRPVCSIVGRRDADLSVIHRARRISKYRIIAREPILCSKSDRPRKEEIASAMRRWSQLLEETVGRYWHQQYAFTPTFEVIGLMD